MVRQWIVEGDSEIPDQYHVVVDDGTWHKAWDLTVGSEPSRQLNPGTFVHVRVNLDRRSGVTVRPVEPPAVARPLAGTDGQPMDGQPMDGQPMDGQQSAAGQE